jgi:hypothetical protein
MSDHALIALIGTVGFVLQIAGLVLLGVKLSGAVREAQQLTRAVAGLVYQESERIRPSLGRP